MASENVTVSIENDNTQQFLDGVETAVLAALEAAGLVAEGYAKRLCPVDTGRLRNSITHAMAGEEPALKRYAPNQVHATTSVTKNNGTAGQPVEDMSEGEYVGVPPKSSEGYTVFIGTNVVYATYVEAGTSRMKAQPFLKPAVQDHIAEYKQIFERFLKGGA